METQPTKKKKGGKMPGAGRPKGLKNKATIDREKFLQEWKDKVAQRSHSLLNVQTMLAVGTIKVFKIVTTTDSKGHSTRSKPELVENDDEIIAALDYEYGDGESPNDEEDYYFVTTKDPENQAINSLLDRTFGKPKESVDVNHTGLNLKELHDALEE